jgi:membrane protease YdiL (CAAX protease family)
MWYLLATALFFLPLHRLLACFILAIFSGLAIFHGVLTALAVIFLLAVLIIALLAQRYPQPKWLAIGLELLLLLSAIALFLHLVPGVHNLQVLDNIKIGPLSTPFSLYYNVDKALIPFILIACLPTLFVVKPAKTVSPKTWAALVISVPLLLLLAVAFGGLKVELHQPDWLLSFVISNVFFVCMAEEVLFRGYLQQRLSRLWGAYPALIITALLFGLFHFAGGTLLVIFACLAGLIYGLAWMWSGRLWVAILFHFGLNLLHLLFFTYPLYQPT